MTGVQTCALPIYPTAISGIAIGAAIGVLISDSSARVTDDAVLNVGGSLYVMAETIDRTRIMARSTAGKDGKVGIAAAISVEDGETNAFLDGTATVAGDVEVSATMLQDMVPVKKIFAIQSVTIGTMTQAGTGSNSKGDIMDDSKSMITSPAGNFIGMILVPKIKSKIFKGPPDTSTPSDTSTFDLAGAVSVVVDMNRATARIGDGNIDGDNLNGDVDAGGNISVFSSVANSPWISAQSSAQSNPDVESQYSTSAVSGSVALSVGIYRNDARASIGAGAAVDAAGSISVRSETLNDYTLSWFTNLIDPWLEKANYTTEDVVQVVKVHTGELVEVRDNHIGGGDVGTWYEYLGTTPKDITLATADLSDETLWLAINPTARKRDAFLVNLTTYLKIGRAHVRTPVTV